MTSLERLDARLDKRDRRLIKDVWLAAENHLHLLAHGHNSGMDKLRKALDKASDEMGEPEDFKP